MPESVSKDSSSYCEEPPMQRNEKRNVKVDAERFNYIIYTDLCGPVEEEKKDDLNEDFIDAPDCNPRSLNSEQRFSQERPEQFHKDDNLSGKDYMAYKQHHDEERQSTRIHSSGTTEASEAPQADSYDCEDTGEISDAVSESDIGQPQSRFEAPCTRSCSCSCAVIVCVVLAILMICMVFKNVAPSNTLIADRHICKLTVTTETVKSDSFGPAVGIPGINKTIMPPRKYVRLPDGNEICPSPTLATNRSSSANDPNVIVHYLNSTTALILVVYQHHTKPIVQCGLTCHLRDTPIDHAFLYKLDKLHKKQGTTYTYAELSLQHTCMQPRFPVLVKFVQTLVEAKLWSVADGVYVPYPTVYPLASYYQGSRELTVHQACNPAPLSQCACSITCHLGDTDTHYDHSFVYQLEKLHQKQQDPLSYIEEIKLHRLFQLSVLTELEQVHTHTQPKPSKPDYSLTVVINPKPPDIPSSTFESFISSLAYVCMWIVKLQFVQLPIVATALVVELTLENVKLLWILMTTFIAVCVQALLRFCSSKVLLQTETSECSPRRHKHQKLPPPECNYASFNTYKVFLILLCLAASFTISDPHTLIVNKSNVTSNSHDNTRMFRVLAEPTLNEQPCTPTQPVQPAIQEYGIPINCKLVTRRSLRSLQCNAGSSNNSSSTHSGANLSSQRNEPITQTFEESVESATRGCSGGVVGDGNRDGDKNCDKSKDVSSEKDSEEDDGTTASDHTSNDSEITSNQASSSPLAVSPISHQKNDSLQHIQPIRVDGNPSATKMVTNKSAASHHSVPSSSERDKHFQAGQSELTSCVVNHYTDSGPRLETVEALHAQPFVVNVGSATHQNQPSDGSNSTLPSLFGHQESTTVETETTDGQNASSTRVCVGSQVSGLSSNFIVCHSDGSSFMISHTCPSPPASNQDTPPLPAGQQQGLEQPTPLLNPSFNVTMEANPLHLSPVQQIDPHPAPFPEGQ